MKMTYEQLVRAVNELGDSPADIRMGSRFFDFTQRHSFPTNVDLNALELARLVELGIVADPAARTEWNTQELQEDFTVEAFQAPFVVVVRKADGVKGSLQFDHSPRRYYAWTEHTA